MGKDLGINRTRELQNKRSKNNKVKVNKSLGIRFKGENYYNLISL